MALAANIPAKFPIPWASTATNPYIRTIPEASQIGITNGAASLTDGYPPLCFQPIASGGVAPWGADTNGILQQITLWNQWQQAGGPVKYDATFATAVNGYPKGAVLASASTIGAYWVNLVDNNTSNPDTGGANWYTFYQGGRYSWSANSPPATNVSLHVGDKATVSFNNLTNIPMSIATTQGVYRVLWIITNTNTPNADIVWYPNDNQSFPATTFSSYGFSVSNNSINGFGTSTTNATIVALTNSPWLGYIPLAQEAYQGRPSMFHDMFAGPEAADTINDRGPYILDFTFSTYTVAKYVMSTGAIHGGPSQFLNIWEDTTTVWTSLGTLSITLSASQSGFLYIERLI